MVLSGPPTAIGGSQNVSASLLRSNSGMLGVEGGPVAPESTFSSLVSARPQLSNINMLGNVSNVSSLLGGQGQPFGNGGSVSVQRGNIDSGAELDPLAGIGNGLGYSSGNPTTSGQFQGQQLMMPNQSLSQQIETQTFQHSQQQFSAPPKTQGQHQFPTSLGPVKLEPQMINEQLGPHNTQQFQSMKNLGHVKLEGITSTRNLGPVKMESPHTNQQSLYLQQQQQQQQQQFLQITRPPSQAAAAQYLQQQQRIFQLQQQQQQQQQLLKVPQQRGQLGQQFQQQSLAMRSPMRSVYEPGMCAKRVTHYMYQQQRRPDDNNIDFWRKFVNEYFTPNAKKKWCVSMYGSGRQTAGVFPQDVWHCDICNQKPGRGFEATSEVLPRLFKIKYESGTLEELLYVDMPREYQNSSGQIVLDYAKAIQESLFEQLRVVREGQLRIVFSPDLKICSWEFCARRHEELIPRRLLIPQVSQLGAASQKYQAVTQNASPTVPELQNNCNMFLSSARQLAKALEVPLVNDLGYTKRYVRCLQISEVVNCMKDLIDYSRQTGAGPMESLAKFPRRTGTTSVVPPGQGQLSEEQSQKQRLLQQPTPMAHQNTTNVDQTSLQPGSMHPPTSNGVVSSSAIAGLFHQDSMNSRQHQSSVPNVGSPYGNSSSSFQSPTHSSSGNNPPLPEISMQQQRENSEPSNGASTAQKIYQEMMSNQHNGLGGGIVGRVHGSLGTDVKHANGVVPAMGMGLSQNQTTLVNGLRAAMNSSGRVGMNWERTMSLQHQHQQQQQQELSNQMLNGLGPVSSGFNSLQYDWKPSP